MNVAAVDPMTEATSVRIQDEVGIGKDDMDMLLDLLEEIIATPLTGTDMIQDTLTIVPQPHDPMNRLTSETQQLQQRLPHAILPLRLLDLKVCSFPKIQRNQLSRGRRIPHSTRMSPPRPNLML
jgi:hypothetical protein